MLHNHRNKQSFLYFLVMVLCITLLTIAGILRLNSISHNYHRIQFLLENISANINFLSSMEWQAIGEKKVNHAIPGRKDEVESVLQDSFQEIMSIIGDDSQLQKAHDLHSLYVSYVSKELDLIAAGAFEDAEIIDKQYVDPTYDELHELLQSNARKYRSKAVPVEMTSRYGIPSMVIFVICVMIFLTWRLQGLVYRSRLADEKLEEAYRNTRTILEKAPFGIFVVNSEGRIEFVNKALADMEKQDPDHIIGETISKIPAFEKCAISGKIASAMKGHVFMMECIETPLPTSDKSLIRNFIGIPSGDATDRKAIVFVEDVTAIKQAEKDRTELLSQLMHSQKMEGLGRLAGAIAHDFNNYLTALMGNAELLERLSKPDDASSEKAKTIQEIALKASRLIEQLLAFSRKKPLDPVTMNLNDVLRQTAKIVLRLVGEDIECHFDLDPRLKNIKADPAQMEQVLINLVINSRDAMADGGELFVTTKNVVFGKDPSRKNHGLESGEYVLLSVRDTGIGISGELKDRIFEPFFTTKEKGTGLGLSTVYSIVTQFNGTVYIDSESGLGTTFNIYLPYTEDTASKEDSTMGPATEKLATGTETILLVEDNAEIRELISASLASLGYTVLPFSNGDKAFENIRELNSPPDLLLTDVVLPGKRGSKIAGFIKEQFPGIKIIFMSGYSKRFLGPFSGDDPEVAFLSKPFSISTIATKIREVLDSK